jgi:hypothetical protein
MERKELFRIMFDSVWIDTPFPRPAITTPMPRRFQRIGGGEGAGLDRIDVAGVAPGTFETHHNSASL